MRQLVFNQACCAFALFFVGLTGCNLASFPSAYVIADLRAVAVVAEPPEASPGQRVQITAYFAEPQTQTSAAPNVGLSLCPDRGDLNGYYDCEIANRIVMSSGAATASAQGVWAYQSDYVVPQNLLNTGRSAVALQYGFYEFLLLRAQSGDWATDALKRLVVTPASVVKKNQNPKLLGIDIWEGEQLIGNDQSAPQIRLDTEYQLAPRYDAQSLEAYQLRDYRGNLMNLNERASFAWSCSAPCEIGNFQTLGDDRTTIKIPKPAQNQSTQIASTFFLVMRDERGGEQIKWINLKVIP